MLGDRGKTSTDRDDIMSKLNEIISDDSSGSEGGTRTEILEKLAAIVGRKSGGPNDDGATTKETEAPLEMLMESLQNMEMTHMNTN